jgi:hypothetical protein
VSSTPPATQPSGANPGLPDAASTASLAADADTPAPDSTNDQTLTANLPGTPAPPTDSKTADLLASNSPAADTVGLTNMFESVPPGSNVVFILDHSKSMQTGGKTAAARQELLRHIKAMKPESKFYVLFSDSGGYDGMPASGPVEANPENIRSMTNWLFSTGDAVGADPAKAVERALALTPAPDTLWVLSGDDFSQSAVDSIRQTNAATQARINTIGFYSRNGEPELKDIASQNHGIYHFVPPPDTNANVTPGGTLPPAATTNANRPSSP